jgi:hypothetical protein
MAYFILLHRDQKKAKYLVKIFAREIWRLHGIPTYIILDQDSRFILTEWKLFLGILEIRPRMSTSFHPQTDSQTE